MYGQSELKSLSGWNCAFRIISKTVMIIKRSVSMAGTVVYSFILIDWSDLMFCRTLKVHNYRLSSVHCFHFFCVIVSNGMTKWPLLPNTTIQTHLRDRDIEKYMYYNILYAIDPKEVTSFFFLIFLTDLCLHVCYTWECIGFENWVHRLDSTRCVPRALGQIRNFVSTKKLNKERDRSHSEADRNLS